MFFFEFRTSPKLVRNTTYALFREEKGMNHVFLCRIYVALIFLACVNICTVSMCFSLRKHFLCGSEPRVVAVCCSA
jgi:hypothetical protein